MSSVELWLRISALGIYLHATYVSLTLGIPLGIIVLLVLHSRTKNTFYLSMAKKLTIVLGMNFALGAITGTLVEFGLVQVWPGSIIAIATSALSPLALELIAFVNEIALLVLFIVTLGKTSTGKSIAIITAYWAFALLSGVLITSVNSWLVAPMGTGGVAQALYPFMPVFGEQSMDAQKLVALKVLLLATGSKLQSVIQSPDTASRIGLLITDPTVAFKGELSLASMAHNLAAAVIVGSSLVLAAYSYRHYKTGREEYRAYVKKLALVLLVLIAVQGAVFGHEMGVAIAKYNPTKFALMEKAEATFTNPIISFLAYGDPSKPIIGFDEMSKACLSSGNKTISDVALALGLDKNALLGLASQLGVQVDEGSLDEVLSTRVADICLADLEEAKSRMSIVHYSYYTKIAAAIIALIAVGLIALHDKLPLIRSKLRIDARMTLALSIVFMVGSSLSASLGWLVREVGRKPWTVYGLLKPEELISISPLIASKAFAAFAVIFILLVNAGGWIAMYIIATRESALPTRVREWLGGER